MFQRPPAIPLVTHDPYFSTWSFREELASAWPAHWTGMGRGMNGIARIDGKSFNFMGLPVPGEVIRNRFSGGAGTCPLRPA